MVVKGDTDEKLGIPHASLKELEPTLRVLTELDQGKLESVELTTKDGSQLKIKYKPNDPIRSQEFRHLRAAVRRLISEAKNGGMVMLAAKTAPALPPKEAVITLRGQIRELDFDSRTGRFRVLKNNPVPEGTYGFEVIGDQSFIDIKNLLGETTVLVECMVEGIGKKRRLLLTSVRRSSGQ